MAGDYMCSVRHYAVLFVWSVFLVVAFSPYFSQSSPSILDDRGKHAKDQDSNVGPQSADRLQRLNGEGQGQHVFVKQHAAHKLDILKEKQILSDKSGQNALQKGAVKSLVDHPAPDEVVFAGGVPHSNEDPGMRGGAADQVVVEMKQRSPNPPSRRKVKQEQNVQQDSENKIGEKNRVNPGAGDTQEAADPQPDRVLLYDTQFGLADAPGTEFHVWHAAFPSFGRPWPMPAKMVTGSRYYEISRTQFVFRTTHENNYIIQEAFTRYRDLLFERAAVSYYPKEWMHQEWRVFSRTQPQRTSLAGEQKHLQLTVHTSGRPWPHLSMNESYSLRVTSRGIFIEATETWGAIRGLETFSQLVWQTRNGRLFINETVITDSPRFKHRGLLVDTARHFIPKDVLLRNLDALSYNKMNVFHWHIVDDQSFPFQSRTFPNLSDKGAFDRTNMVYTYDDIREIVEYARVRGIRVIPEFDSPGHTLSWSKGEPDLMTKCYEAGQWTGYFGPLNPARNATFEFLRRLYTEITELFVDDYIHLGADEVGTHCWETNPEVQGLTRRFGLDRMDLIVDYYFRRLQNVITGLGLSEMKKKRGFVVWQEAYDNGVLLKSGTIVQVWKGDSPTDAHQVARAGHRVLYSACWYLDRVEYGAQWTKYYACDPGIDETESPSNTWMKNVLGGEACMWAEYQTGNTILERIWPLTSAVAERLWSRGDVRSVELAGPRLEEHRCRMSMRGIDVGVASGPGMCEHHNVTQGSGALPYRGRDIRNLQPSEDGPVAVEMDDRPLRRGRQSRFLKHPPKPTKHMQVSTQLLLMGSGVLVACILVWAMRSKATVLNQVPCLRLFTHAVTLRRSFYCLAGFILLYIISLGLNISNLNSPHH